jgi:hypothetical protein
MPLNSRDAKVTETSFLGGGGGSHQNFFATNVGTVSDEHGNNLIKKYPRWRIDTGTVGAPRYWLTATERFLGMAQWPNTSVNHQRLHFR